MAAGQSEAGLKAIVTGSDASVFDNPVLHFNELRPLKLAQLETLVRVLSIIFLTSDGWK